ncbi:MAG: hypothetical protein K0B02_01765 [DPANN group archaeon]|nr:hypothetical protein [DPANN group archaeon]
MSKLGLNTIKDRELQIYMDAFDKIQEYPITDNTIKKLPNLFHNKGIQYIHALTYIAEQLVTDEGIFVGDQHVEKIINYLEHTHSTQITNQKILDDITKQILKETYNQDNIIDNNSFEEFIYP